MSRSSSLRALPACELRFPTVRIVMPKAWLASHLPTDGCHHTGRLRRTASPRGSALPVASLHDRFGSYGRSTTFSPRHSYPPIAVAIAAVPKTPTLCHLPAVSSRRLLPGTSYPPYNRRATVSRRAT